MAIDALTPYTSTTPTTAKNTGRTESNSLSMDDFFTLMVAQLSNQDMNNTMDNSQFLAQMAQFSMVQALTDLNAMSQTSYSVGLIGKEVTVAESNSDGSLRTVTGIVESVNLYNGDAKVVVEGTQYDLSSVMIVSQPKIIIPDSSMFMETQTNNTIEEINSSSIVEEPAETDETGGTNVE